MTKKQLIELWNSIDDNAEIEFPHVVITEKGRIKKIVLITEC